MSYNNNNNANLSQQPGQPQQRPAYNPNQGQNQKRPPQQQPQGGNKQQGKKSQGNQN